MNCIFCKIIAGEIPSERVYEDEHCIAFKDIHPVAPVHILVVPKNHIETPTLMDQLFFAVGHVAESQGVSKSGFRTVINTGNHAGQEVAHLHIHVIGGKQLGKMG